MDAGTTPAARSPTRDWTLADSMTRKANPAATNSVSPAKTPATVRKNWRMLGPVRLELVASGYHTHDCLIETR